MADGHSNTQFNNILQELERDLSDQITPALDQTAESLRQLLAEARERVSASAGELRQVLEQSLAMSTHIRAELETFERVHTQAASSSQTQLEATQAPFAEHAERLLSTSAATSDAAVELDAAFPTLSEALTELTAKHADAGAQLQEQIEHGSAQVNLAVETLQSGTTEAIGAAEQSFAALAQACEGLNGTSTALVGVLSGQTLEQLARSAEELRGGVVDAAQAAETAGALILDGLEIFQGASEQLERVFGEDTEELMGTVRQITDLIETIKPFIEIAKNI